MTTPTTITPATPPAPKAKPAKITRTVLNARVEMVLEARLAGALPNDIRTLADQEGWGISERQVQRYCQHADKLLVKYAERDRDKMIAKHVAMRYRLYGRCVEKGDEGTALRVLDSMCTLLGLFPKAPPAPPPAAPAAWNLQDATDEEIAVLARLAGKTAELTVTQTTATVKLTTEEPRHDREPLTLDAPAGSDPARDVPQEVPELPPVDEPLE